MALHGRSSEGEVLLKGLAFLPEGRAQDLELDSADLQLENHSGCGGGVGPAGERRAEAEPAREAAHLVTGDDGPHCRGMCSPRVTAEGPSQLRPKLPSKQ